MRPPQVREGGLVWGKELKLSEKPGGNTLWLPKSEPCSSSRPGFVLEEHALQSSRPKVSGRILFLFSHPPQRATQVQKPEKVEVPQPNRFPPPLQPQNRRLAWTRLSDHSCLCSRFGFLRLAASRRCHPTSRAVRATKRIRRGGGLYCKGEEGRCREPEHCSLWVGHG